jgi:putative tryptophan/tyrosine transport system substrate-binding protein
MMRRREFIAGLAGAAAWPAVARAQQSALPVVGFLSLRSSDSATDIVAPFRQGLKEAGFVEGRNVTIEYRWADDQSEKLPALAADLVRSRVALILAAGNAAAVAAKTATTSIPIAFFGGGDAVMLGLAASLDRPCGNVTGFTSLANQLVPKQLGLLLELVPKAALVAFLVNPNSPETPSVAKAVEEAARTRALHILFLNANTDPDIDNAFKTIVLQRADAILVGNDAFFNRRTTQLVALAARHALPTIYGFREYAVAGGLMSYGSSLAEESHQSGIYTGRILMGEKPSNLPVQQPTKFELVINLKTAGALSLTIPETLLATADEVIQ